jgi:hypothetical protein
MLNINFNAFGITLTAAAVYGAMDGQIIDPISFGCAAVAVALFANLPTSSKRKVFEGRRADVDRHARQDGVASAA